MPTTLPEQTSESEAISEIAARLRLAITRMARRLRQEAGTDLTPSQASALASIELRGPLTPSELAAIERVKRPTATRIVARLEEDALLTRAADPHDGRSSIVSATPRGRALLARLRTRKNAYLAKRLRSLDDDDVATLARAAEILEHLQDGERG
ncbi:MAG: MarR family winged helix-turn-helix transcriptional regulator [Solirubrobacterales bacterium]